VDGMSISCQMRLLPPWSCDGFAPAPMHKGEVTSEGQQCLRHKTHHSSIDVMQAQPADAVKPKDQPEDLFGSNTGAPHQHLSRILS